jgi:hypothetical protein
MKKIKKILTKSIRIFQKKFKAILKNKRTKTYIIGSLIALPLILIAIIAFPYLMPKTYQLGKAEGLLSSANAILAKKISYNSEDKSFNFSNGQALDSSESTQTGASQIAVKAYKDSAKGITVTDSTNKIDFSMTPEYGLALGEQTDNRIIYPLTNGIGWTVYTMLSTGAKEDIVLTKNNSDSMSLKYNLSLGNNLEAKMETDGGIGIYGNTLLSSDITTSSESDAALLVKARENASKNTLLFTIPKPTIIELNQKESAATATYSLNGETLTINVTNLDKANYPLTIDPSIYVVTAQQFMAGNNETNIDFDISNKLIKKSATTGARFDEWNSTLDLPASSWGAGVVAAGGYIYTAGGTSFSGQVYSTQGPDNFTVPDGVTSINVKMWGGGGGAGAGGSAATGGNGGGSGYVAETISVTPGETLTVYVGGGGAAGTRNTAGGGGGGGGYSSLYRGSTLLALAAGGGGGGGGRATSTHTGGDGGAGGGTTGVAGSAAGGTSTVVSGGGGGTQSSGGAAGTGGRNVGTAGSSLTGGLGADGRSSSGADGSANNRGLATGGSGGTVVTTTYSAGGGGGSGYFGGGGGSGSNGTTITRGGSGGGGGSSYTITGATNVTNATGSNTSPGNSSDPYRNSAGNGGTGGAIAGVGTAGANGLIAITYGANGSSVSEAVSWAKFNSNNGTIESANPGNGSCSGWCTTAAYNLPSARTNFSLVAYNGFLYAMGGVDNNGIRQSTVYIAKLGANGEPQLWNPTNSDKSTWTYWYTDAGLTSTRSSFSAVAYNNRMYVVGGLTGADAGSVLSSVQIANINPNGTLGTWVDSVSIPTSRHSHSIQVYNDRLYVIGGSEWWIGGPPTTSVVYSKINSDGTLNAWNSTTPLTSGRSSSGGNFSTIWGAYIYVSGGCTTLDFNGYCTAVASDTQVASINADGSLDVWNNIANVSSQRVGHSLLAWRNNIYEIGGCSTQNTSTGDCGSNTLKSIFYGTINQDGDASTVNQSVAAGTTPCNGSSPTDCNLPGTSYIGNMLSGTAIVNGYLYIIGGCTNNTCSTASSNVAYASISSTGDITAPSTCPTGTIRGNIWCVDSTNLVPSTIAATSTVIFNNRIYLIGGLNGTSNTGYIYYTTVNSNGSIGAWTSQSLSSLGVNSVSFLYSYARSNPSTASTYPGNLYIFGGCTSSTGAGCTAYSPNVYKCNIAISGTISSCSTSGQLQIGTLPDDTQPGLGIMTGTVYANYIYLIGGVSPNLVDITTLRYAKFDDNNNIVAVTGNSWIQSPNEMLVGRRRAAAFGYNGYIYVVGGYDATAGVLADIEFIKVNVSDGSLGSTNEGFNVSAVSINQRWGLSVAVSNSFAYVIGGCTVGSSPSGCTTRTDVVQTFQIYNNDSGAPAGFTTSSNSYLTNPNRIGASSTILNGYIYVAGGCISDTDCTTATNNVSYAPIDTNGAIGTWQSTTSPLPANLTGGELEAAGGSLYYIGGEKIDDSTCTPTGQAKFEQYNNITGTLITDLYNNAAFPNSPSSTQTLTNATLSGPSGIADNFGGRLSAVICAPQTGNYTFWISSDDSSELRLSTDSSPSNVMAIASVNGWTNVNTWNTYSSQQSAQISLVAGKAYYIEANYKEGTGGDHVEVGWQLPDSTYERPITNTRYRLPTTTVAPTIQSAVYYATPSGGNINNWATASNGLPSARSNFSSTVWNNRIYVVGGEGTGTSCTASSVCNTIFVSPQLDNGGNISSEWTTNNSKFDVARSGASTTAYANNLYVLGGFDGSNYLSDTQYAQINTIDGTVGDWTFSTNLPRAISQGDSFAANGYIYLVGGRSDATSCSPSILIAPISANTTIASGNHPTGVGEWFETNQRYTGNRYDSSAVYYDGKAYVIGGGCGTTITYASPVIQQTTLLSQPQVAKYSIMIDTDSDVFPNYWLLNGVDNSIGAKWQLKYQSMTDATTSCTATPMTTWGRMTNFGSVTLGLPGVYTPLDNNGNDTNCARYFYFNVTIDSSQAYGYPDDVTRGPTITDITLQFTSDPSKRLMHGRTFTGGLQQPLDTPYYSH